MARQPYIIQPFRPFASGRQIRAKTKNVVTDDRRAWFATIPGRLFSNEVVVPGTGAAPLVESLTEALSLRLPRPEPVTLSFHPWVNTVDKFRLMSHLMAESYPTTDANNQARWGRIYVEWGTGQSRAWTYFDAGPGSLQLPSVSEVRVYGWSYSTSYVLSVNAQVGYASADLSATWTFRVKGTVAQNYTVELPNFSRNITGYGGWLAYSLNDLGDIRLMDNFGEPLMNWSIRPPLAPNPSARPYPPNSVPLSGAARRVRIELVTVAVSIYSVSAVVTVKV